MVESRGNGARLRFVHATALLLSAAYFILISLYLSSHRLMWADEFTGLFIIADPSWRHAYESWSRASDSGGPLFYILGHGLVFLFGPHPWVLRLFSAGCLWGAAVLWFELLRRKFSTATALFSCALVWLGDTLFINHLGEVRFYGQLVLATVITAVAMIWIEDHKPRAVACFLLMFAGSSLLITSHMLGVIYSACVITTLLFSRLPLRRRIAAIGGALSSWTLILLFRTAMRVGAAAYTWVQMPHSKDLVRYYVHTPIYSVSHPALSVLINLLLGLLIAVGVVVAYSNNNRNWAKNDGRRLLLIFSGILLLLPLGMFILCHLYKPVWVSRYMMPYEVGLVGCCAGALWMIGNRTGFPERRSHKLLIAISACVAVLIVHAFNLREQRLVGYSDLKPYLSLTSPLSLVLQDGDSFLQSRHYGGSRGSRVFFILRKGLNGTLNAVEESGYQEGIVYDEEFFATNKAFLYLDIPWAHDSFLQHWKAMHPEWHIRQVGELPYQTKPVPLLEIEQ